MRDYDTAIKCYDKAINSCDESAYRNKGIALEKQGNKKMQKKFR